MNKKQKIVLRVMSALILLMLFFPPFYTEFVVSNSKLTYNNGYSFILHPPMRAGNKNSNSNINTKLLFLQWIAVGFVGGILFMTLKEE